MTEKFIDHFLRITGAGVPGVLISVLLEIPVFLFSGVYNWGMMNIPVNTAFLVSLVFFILFLCLNIWALKSLPLEKRGKILVKEGPYKFIRHPCYFAKIFLLLPGLAVLFRTWLPIVTIPILMIIWNGAVKLEEGQLKKDFGKQFDEYCQKTGKFFPRLTAK